jgi:hypothetical protein
VRIVTLKVRAGAIAGVMCHALHVEFAHYAAHVTRHTSHVTRHTSHVTHDSPPRCSPWIIPRCAASSCSTSATSSAISFKNVCSVLSNFFQKCDTSLVSFQQPFSAGTRLHFECFKARHINFLFVPSGSYFARDPVTRISSVIHNDGLKPNQDAAKQQLLRSVALQLCSVSNQHRVAR